MQIRPDVRSYVSRPATCLGSALDPASVACGTEKRPALQVAIPWSTMASEHRRWALLGKFSMEILLLTNMSAPRGYEHLLSEEQWQRGHAQQPSR